MECAGDGSQLRPYCAKMWVVMRGKTLERGIATTSTGKHVKRHQNGRSRDRDSGNEARFDNQARASWDETGQAFMQPRGKTTRANQPMPYPIMETPSSQPTFLVSFALAYVRGFSAP